MMYCFKRGVSFFGIAFQPKNAANKLMNQMNSQGRALGTSHLRTDSKSDVPRKASIQGRRRRNMTNDSIRCITMSNFNRALLIQLKWKQKDIQNFINRKFVFYPKGKLECQSKSIFKLFDFNAKGKKIKRI